MKLTITSKLHTITAAALVGMVAISGLGLISLRAQNEQDHMAKTRQLIVVASGMAADFAAQERVGRPSHAEAPAAAIPAASAL